MTEDPSLPAHKAAQLQEALDTVAQIFDYPASLSIRYAATDGTKRTTFEIGDQNGDSVYELRYDGRNDEAEPELVSVDRRDTVSPKSPNEMSK